jgi:hypothetical protein
MRYRLLKFAGLSGILAAALPLAAALAVGPVSAGPAQASQAAARLATAAGASLAGWHTNRLPASWHGVVPEDITPDAVCSDPNVMVNYNSGKVAEVYHSQTQNYANVDQWAYNGSLTQKWCFYYVEEFAGTLPVYEIVNDNSGKCLDVYHSTDANGANVDQYTCNESLAQLWAVSGGKYAYLFYPLLSAQNENMGLEKVLEVYHSGTADGDNVDIWDSNGTKTQNWCPGSCG